MLEFNSIKDSKLKHHEKKVRFEYYKCYWIKMSLQLMSIPSFDNNSLTASERPSFAAKINAVLLNVRVQFHKWFWI